MSSSSIDHLDSPTLREAQRKGADYTNNNRQIYTAEAYWELLLSVLQAGYQKESIAKAVCMAISVFADYGKLKQPAMCDAVMNAVQKHLDKEAVLERTLCAVGSLAACHEENQIRLTRLTACDLANQLLEQHKESEAVAHGTFCAVAGLAQVGRYHGCSHIP